MTTPPGAVKAPAPAGAQAAPVAPWPFPVGVFDQEVQSAYDNTVTATTGTVQFPDVQIEPDGWSRGWWFDFNLTATNATITVVPAADFPFNAVNTVLLKGTNVPQTFGPFGGYDWMTINKYGGYQGQGDPRADATYVNTATSSANFSAHWTLYMPLEISAADGLGDLQNQSDNSIYRVAVTQEALATMFPATAPSGTVTTEMKVEQDSYSEPVAALALSGRPIQNAPPVPGTRQCWQQEDDTGIVNGSHTTKITNGVGYAYRSVILKEIRTSGNSRANGESDFPDPMEIWLGGTRIKRLMQNVLKAKMARRYQYVSTTKDAALGPENGIRVLNWNQDVGLIPGDEARRKYLRTQDGNVFKIVGTWSNAGTLYITSNYVIPRGGPANNASIVA